MILSKQIENELFAYFNSILEYSKPKICPTTSIQVLNYNEVDIAATMNNIIYINFNNIFNTYYDALYNNCRQQYILYTKRLLTEVIVHELYHIEQEIIHALYNLDKDYKANIEKDVIYMSLIFILQNSYNINKLGVLIDEFEIRYRMKLLFDNYIPLYERSLATENNIYCLNIILYFITYCEDRKRLIIKNDFLENISSYKNIVLNINNIQYILKKDYVYNNNYNELNQIINKYNTIDCDYKKGEVIVNVLYDHISDTHNIEVVDFRTFNLFKQRR